MKHDRSRVTCPYCHYSTMPDLSFEVVFDKLTLSFKCSVCKRDVRIYVKMEAYGEFVKDG